MKIKLLLLGLFLILPGGIRDGWASEYKIIESGICPRVVDHRGMDCGEGFERTVGTLSCFTKIEGPASEAAGRNITHVWYYKDVQRFRIALPFKGDTWVTHSEKNILPAETGDWRVDVVAPDGSVIGVLQFFIKE